MSKLNVITELQHLTPEEVNRATEKNKQPYGICMFNFSYNINIGTTVRTANAFGASEVIYVGRRGWDRRGAVGAHHYTTMTHYREWSDVIWDGSLVLVDNIDGADSMMSPDYVWPENPLFIFGTEHDGVTEEVAADCDHFAYLPQVGATRSLNVANAAAATMALWLRDNYEGELP